MDHIEQLKKIRSDAIARIHNSADFKLAGKLGLLIEELGATVEDNVALEETEEVQAAVEEVVEKPVLFTSSYEKPQSDDFSDLTSDKMIDELVAEIESDAAELDGLMAETNSDLDAIETDDEDGDHIGPFLKPETPTHLYTNGAAH